MQLPDPRSTTQLTDPRALRALAHPTRMRLLTLLRSEGAMTATQAGERLGESSGSCSFHLRQLARYGLVTEVPGVPGRSRPWQATAAASEWSAGSEGGDELTGIVLRGYAAQLAGWAERAGTEPAEWRDAALVSDTTTYLTAEELRELGRRFGELLDAYLDRSNRPELRPEGSRPVTVLGAAFPTDAT